MRSLLAMLLAFASAASAEGLDRDTLLTDAPAVPAVGTVRVTGAGVATQNTDNGATRTRSSSFTGSIGWTPIANLHGDVGAYFQVGAQGPAARIRYQLLNQFSHGLDLATGIRFKTVGFHPDRGEVEFLLAGGRGPAEEERPDIAGRRALGEPRLLRRLRAFRMRGRASYSR